MARNVSSVRMTSWKKMWVFCVSNSRSVDCTNVSLRSQMTVDSSNMWMAEVWVCWNVDRGWMTCRNGLRMCWNVL